MRIKAVVSYNGYSYQGWAKQINTKTIQGCIEEVLSRYFDTPINIYASGRTDSGVHALGQVFHFDINKDDLDLSKAQYSFNMMLPKDIDILSLEKVDENFHARYSAKEKHYRYLINLKAKDPFSYMFMHLNPYDMDIDLFKKALKIFEGKHNFQDFTSKEEDEQNFIRFIREIDVKIDNNLLSIDIYGDGFMRYMVRYIIGASLMVAIKKEELSFIYSHLDQNKRNIISYKIEPQGLYLVEVKY